jgi:hypothetical protein
METLVYETSSGKEGGKRPNLKIPIGSLFDGDVTSNYQRWLNPLIRGCGTSKGTKIISYVKPGYGLRLASTGHHSISKIKSHIFSQATLNHIKINKTLKRPIYMWRG